jgi:hypothetical protein
MSLPHSASVSNGPLAAAQPQPGDPVRTYVASVARGAREVSAAMARAETARKDGALRMLAQLIRDRAADLAKVNEADVSRMSRAWPIPSARSAICVRCLPAYGSAACGCRWA